MPLETKTTKEQQEHQKGLELLFKATFMSVSDLMISLGLYLKCSALAKILFINELYQLILDIPGVIVEFGCWRGQNLVLFENLRAIYEPFNQTRRIIGFDTFEGHTAAPITGYELEDGYNKYLEQLLDWHEKNNILGNIKKHEVIKGDVCKTVPDYFKKNDEVMIALAYFDLASYKPTKVCLETIKARLQPGSVIMLDEYNNPAYEGETRAFREVFGRRGYSIRLSKYMRDRTIVILD